MKGREIHIELEDRGTVYTDGGYGIQYHIMPQTYCEGNYVCPHGIHCQDLTTRTTDCAECKAEIENMSEQKQHTQTPWVNVNGTLIRGPHGEAVAATKWSTYPSAIEYEANARFIVTAVNCHDELLATLKDVWEFWAGGDAPKELEDKIVAAIAKAEGR
jgi:hypothetical protein